MIFTWLLLLVPASLLLHYFVQPGPLLFSFGPVYVILATAFFFVEG